MPLCDSPRVYYPLTDAFLRVCRSAPDMTRRHLLDALACFAYRDPSSMALLPHVSTWAEVCTEGYVHGYHGPVPPSDDAMLDLAFALDRAFDLD